MKEFNDAKNDLKTNTFYGSFDEKRSLYRDHNQEKAKCSQMEIGINRVYNVLMVLKLRQSENRQPMLCT